jgi:hypothetical protein
MDMHPQGHDGYSADLPDAPTSIPNSPVLSLTPYVATASARCGNPVCFSRVTVPGRPGSELRIFMCDDCKQLTRANGYLGFRFEGWN